MTLSYPQSLNPVPFILGEDIIGMEGAELSNLIGRGERVCFMGDMNIEERFPDVHSWIIEKNQLVANMDVLVRARNFKMRVYLYDPNVP